MGWEERRSIMDTKKSLIILALGFALVASGAFSCATWQKVEIPLMAAKPHPGASGTTKISDRSLTIQAKGLRPNAVYTVWLVNMKPKEQKAGAGKPPYTFRTDSQGVGSYSSSLSGSPFGKWQMLMIMLHPSGDPTDMKNMVGALSTKIPATK
jgi:hypothetical protein